MCGDEQRVVYRMSFYISIEYYVTTTHTLVQYKMSLRGVKKKIGDELRVVYRMSFYNSRK